jgi:hypothetical protein
MGVRIPGMPYFHLFLTGGRPTRFFRSAASIKTRKTPWSRSPHRARPAEDAAFFSGIPDYRKLTGQGQRQLLARGEGRP